MPYGSMLVDSLQSSTSNTAPVIYDGNSREIGRFSRGLVNYSSSGQTIRSSFNISSVTRNATGDTTQTFTVNFGDANYVFSVAGDQNNAIYPRGYSMQSAYNTPMSTDSFRLLTSYTASFASSQTNENTPYLLITISR